jgi:integrase
MDSKTNNERSDASEEPPQRMLLERGVHVNPSTGGFEIQYTNVSGRADRQHVAGGFRSSWPTPAEAQTRNTHSVAMRSFIDVGEEWLAAQTHLRPRTHDLYRTALRRHLAPRIGTMPIGEVDEEAIAGVIADLQAGGLSGWTVRGILVPLGRVLAYAVRLRLISSNPMNRLERRERPSVVQREMRILRPEEIDSLLCATTPAYRALLATAIFTGLRQSELLGLKWADVDFESSVVHVRRQLDRSGHYSQPKTPKALRSVVLMPSLAALLHEHRVGSSHDDPSDPVFATTTGRPMYYRNVTRRGLAAAIEKAGLAREGEARLRFHDLRHTYAALLISQGLNIVFISRQLGHASPSMTLDVYGGLFDRAEHARRAADGLEAAFSEMLTLSPALPAAAADEDQ